MQKRYNYIDIIKGLGILSVIFLHTTDFHGVLIYALPAFFLVSGYLFHPTDSKDEFLKSFNRILVPYLIFYTLISLSRAIFSDNNLSISLYNYFKYLILAGNFLRGDFGVFWYINVLFISLNIFNYLQSGKMKLPENKWILSILIVAIVSLQAIDINLPWNLQTIPLALFYFFIGSIAKQKDINSKFMAWSKRYGLISTLILITLILTPNIFLNIKINDYGIPLVSLLLSIIAVLCLTVISIKIEKVKYLSKFLIYCGKASLFLMFIHQYIHFKLKLFISNPIELFMGTVMLSLLLYKLIQYSKWGKRLLCGNFSKK